MAKRGRQIISLSNKTHKQKINNNIEHMNNTMDPTGLLCLDYSILQHLQSQSKF